MKGLLLADIFFRDYNEDSLWGWNHWLKKTVLRAQCWPQGETFEACKAQTDSPALHVLSNSEHLRQSMHALSYFFSKGDRILFLERPSSRWVVIFRALSKHDPLWMTTLEENMKKLQRNIKWPKNNQEQRHQLCLNHMDTSAFNGKVISYLEPKISHLSNLYTIPSSSIVYYLLYCYCNGIEWHWCPKWLLPLNVALTDIGAVLMTATPLQTRPCAYKL